MTSQTSGDLPKGLEQIGTGASFRNHLCVMLEKIAVLRDMNRKDLEKMTDYMQAYSATPGIRIFTEGTKSNFICFLVEGKLDVLKETGDGDVRRLAVIRPGKTVGEMSLIDELPHSASVVTATPTTLAMLTRLSFERLRDEHPRLAFDLLWSIAQMMSHRLRQTSGQLVDFLDR